MVEDCRDRKAEECCRFSKLAKHGPAEGESVVVDLCVPP